ncbi:hypothetical protein HanIR_Chr17g0891591 [Helianthus annuus]|nr:hypothetical protein HanIR_Chr17g0891591 [Helianthus annuus]
MNFPSYTPKEHLLVLSLSNVSLISLSMLIYSRSSSTYSSTYILSFRVIFYLKLVLINDTNVFEPYHISLQHNIYTLFGVQCIFSLSCNIQFI